MSEDAGGLLGPALVAELMPERVEGRPEIADQLVSDLAHRLRLFGQLGEVVPVVDGAAAERLAVMHDDASVGAGDLKTQAAKAFTNLAAVLKAGKAEPGDVVRLTVYVVNYKPEDLSAVRAAATWFFPGRFAPAMTVVGVQSLFKEGLLVAVDAIAQVTNPQPVTPSQTPG